MTRPIYYPLAGIVMMALSCWAVSIVKREHLWLVEEAFNIGAFLFTFGCGMLAWIAIQVLQQRTQSAKGSVVIANRAERHAHIKFQNQS